MEHNASNAFDRKGFVDRLKKRAAAVGVKTQNEIATKIGKSEGVLSQWKSGAASPNVDDLVAIAAQFNCSLDYLFGIHHQPTNCASLLRAIRQLDLCSALHIESELTCISEEEVGMLARLEWSTHYTDGFSGYTIAPSMNIAIIHFLNNYSRLRNVDLDEWAMAAAVEGIIRHSEEVFNGSREFLTDGLETEGQGADDGEH